jgi:hypothetical protein
LLAAGAALGLVAAGLLAARPWLEQAIRVRIAREASRHGLVAAVREVHLGLRPPLHLRELRVAKPGGWTAVVERLDVGLRPWGRGLVGRLDLDAGPATIDGPGGLRLRVEPTRWRLTGDPTGAVRAELQQADGRLEVTRSESAGGWRIEAIAFDLPAGELVEVFRDGAPILDAGTVNGTVEAEKGLETIRFDTALAAAGLRALALSGEADSCPAPCFGPPADVALELEGTWRPGEGALHLPRWRVTMDGAAASGALALAGLPADPHVDLAFAAEQVDFARLFRTSGLALDGATAIPAAAQPGDAALGSASLAATFKGRLLEARGVAVSQRLEFSPPLRFPAGVERLRADFVHEVRLPSGTRRIDVSPTSPDFIALAEVPPLFLRALLISEDAGFYGHRGIDLSELPPALLANWTRGGAFRGASTITQQLAKNLFLSREKRLDRKLRELSLALLLEAALGKDRILELYVNVIEWGPDLYGLRPAARRYFGREPGELTPRQAAFLVALIPGPVKYQPSFSGGTPTRGFDRLVDEVLAKLRSVDALGEEEYRAALEEVLCVEPPSGDAAP